MPEYDIIFGLSYPHLRANYTPFHLQYAKYAGMRPPPLDSSTHKMVCLSMIYFLAYHTLIYVQITLIFTFSMQSMHVCPPLPPLD